MGKWKKYKKTNKKSANKGEKRNRSKMNRWPTLKYIRNRDWSYLCEAYCKNNYLCLLWRSRIVISSIQLVG